MAEASQPPVARFLTGSTMGHVVRMTMTGMAGITFVFLVDAANLFWVSLLGEARLVAALGFAWTLQFFSISFGIGLMIAATALVSRSLGQGDRPRARRMAGAAMVIAAGVQAIVAIVLVTFRHEFLALAGAGGETLDLAARFLLISVPSLPIMAIGMVGSAVLRAEGDATRAMVVTLSSGAVSVVLDPILIFGLGLGLDGAAVNIAVARAVSCLVALHGVIRVHDLLARPTARTMRNCMRPFAGIAVPAIATQLSTPFGNAIVTRAVAAFGDDAVAGWAVVARLTVLAFGGIFSLSGAIGGIIGQNYGGGRIDRVQQTLRDALLFCAVYTVLAWAGLALLTGWFIGIFGLSEDGATVLRAFTLLAAGGFIFTGALFTANSAFNNLDRPLWSTGLNWFRDGVLLWPVVALMSVQYGAAGVIWGQGLASVVVGSFALWLALAYVGRLAA